MTGEQLDVIKLAEAAGEVTNYAPVFVADDLGFFEDEGIRLESTVVGGPKVVDAIVSGQVDISACGAWRVAAYRYYADPDLRIFAPLTSRCPIFLISRDPVTDFAWSDLHGKTVVLGPLAPPPWLMLNLMMKSAGADVSQVKAIRDLNPAESGTLYRAGLGDYFFAMPPFSEVLVEEGHHRAASFAEAGGIPWSVYFAKRQFLEADDRAVRFATALSRGVEWLLDNDPADSPNMLSKHFPTVSEEAAAAAIRTSRDHGVWARGSRVDEGDLMRWQGLAAEYGLIGAPVPYGDIVDTRIAEAVERGQRHT